MNEPILNRRGLLGLLAALPIFGRCADAGPPSFELVPVLRAGQQWRFAFERKVTRGDTVMHWYRAPLHLQVLEASGDGALLEWVEGVQTIVDVDPRRRPLLEIGLAAMRDVPLQLRLDAGGNVRALANAAAVRQTCLGLMDVAADRLGADPAMRPLVDAMLPALKAGFATQALVASASLREPMILLGAMGRRFGANEPVEFRTALTHPMDGAPLPAIARFSIRGVKPRSNRAELGWLMVSDPTATTAAARYVVEVGTAVAALVTDTGHDPAPALPDITLEERGDFVIDTRTAWPASVAHVRTVRAGAMAQIDATSFRLVQGLFTPKA